MDRLDLLFTTHGMLVAAAGLPEGARPYSVQSNLSKIEELIMQEINNSTPKNDTPTTPKSTDDIHF